MANVFPLFYSTLIYKISIINMILCPKCKNLAYFDSYFGKYSCGTCYWEDKWYSKNRHKKDVNIWAELDKHILQVYKEQDRIDKLNKITGRIDEQEKI